MNKRDRGRLIFIWAVATAILVLVALAVRASAQCCPTDGCPTPYGGWAAGIPGPYGGGVGVRGGQGNGLQVGVGGPYGGVVGAQVGPGPRVQVGVIPGRGYAVAPVPAAVQHCPAVVRIETVVGNTTKHGTGTLIVLGGRWHILTAAHILAPGVNPVAFVAGQPITMRIVATDALHDVALLARIGGQYVSAPAMEVSGVVPSMAAWQGFAGGATVVGANGQVQIVGDLLTVPGKAAEGTSGGPIYCPAGLVSVITEANNGPGYWVTAGPRPDWLFQWVHAAYETDQGNGGLPVPTPGTGEDSLPPRPVVQVTRDEFDAAIERLEKRDQQIVDSLMVHSRAIAELKLSIDSGAVGPAGPPGPPGKDADPAAMESLAARVAALEAANEGPLFATETYIDDKLIDRQEIKRGSTLEYRSELIEGAPTDSFRIETRED